MQKIKALSSILLLSFGVLSAQESEPAKEHKKASFAVSSGVVIKNLPYASPLYMANVFTADMCLQPWDHWGMGFKLSYWKGKPYDYETYQKIPLSEIPFIWYVRTMRTMNNHPRMQLYGSLGGGFALVVTPILFIVPGFVEPIVEAEVGWNYQISDCISFTNAIRYIPSLLVAGGLDIRFGLSFDF